MTSDPPQGDLSYEERVYEAFLAAAEAGQLTSLESFLAAWPAATPELCSQLERFARQLPVRVVPDLGPYVGLARLGAGGMGVVWRAREVDGERVVAVKRLSAAFASSPAHIERFRREARVLASLKHPGIAAVIALRKAADGALLLVMECVAGEDLSHRVARGPLPVGEALAISLQIARAMEAAHAQGVIHRDLKPSNVMLETCGRVRVLDFGLAKHVGSETVALTRTGELLGTPGYMSPEQATGGAVDARTDVFAFGCLVFEMLSGRPAASMRAAVEFELLPDGTPDWVRELIQAALQPEARRRPAHMGEVRAAFEAALESAGS
ncbi:MAG: serine/threonine protein kinase [Chlamydiales bacterium]